MSENIISKLTKVLSWVIMGVSIVLTVLFYSTDGVLTPDTFAVDKYILWAYLLFGIAGFLALVFPVYFFIKNPKDALKTLGGLAAMGVVLFIGYIFSDTTPIIASTVNPDFENTNVLILTDTGLIATYILFGAALLLLVYTGISNAIRK